jgi:hypothetical protein
MRSKNADDNLICWMKRHRRRKRNVWNCYIERVIYDQIYKYIMQVDEQDFGHRYQLRYVRQEMFETCYKLNEFYMYDIHVSMDETYLVPISLELHYRVINC